MIDLSLNNFGEVNDEIKNTLIHKNEHSKIRYYTLLLINGYLYSKNYGLVVNKKKIIKSNYGFNVAKVLYKKDLNYLNKLINIFFNEIDKTNIPISEKNFERVIKYIKNIYQIYLDKSYIGDIFKNYATYNIDKINQINESLYNDMERYIQNIIKKFLNTNIRDYIKNKYEDTKNKVILNKIIKTQKINLDINDEQQINITIYNIRQIGEIMKKYYINLFKPYIKEKRFFNNLSRYIDNVVIKFNPTNSTASSYVMYSDTGEEYSTINFGKNITLFTAVHEYIHILQNFLNNELGVYLVTNDIKIGKREGSANFHMMLIREYMEKKVFNQYDLLTSFNNIEPIDLGSYIHLFDGLNLDYIISKVENDEINYFSPYIEVFYNFYFRNMNVVEAVDKYLDHMKIKDKNVRKSWRKRFMRGYIMTDYEGNILENEKLNLNIISFKDILYQVGFDFKLKQIKENIGNITNYLDLLILFT